MACVFIVMLFVVIALVSYPTSLLWNWLMPEIFGLPTINSLQASGLLLLSLLFFGRTPMKSK